MTRSGAAIVSIAEKIGCSAETLFGTGCGKPSVTRGVGPG